MTVCNTLISVLTSSAMIKFLPDAVKAQLRSGIAICSLQQCVEELVLNSIDAGATCVAVKVDIEACKLQVVDNGSGIDRQDLDRVGNRYNTSKCNCLADLESLRFHGYRGEAVASIASLSGMVEISSRTKLSTKTFIKVFSSGQSVGVFEAEAVRPSAGTTVTVCNFFYNLPVRKKHVDPVLEMERIRQRVEAISLMHPSISFTVKKECTGAMLVQLSKVRSTYYRFAQIHGLGKAQKLCEVKHLYGQFEITGHIGCEGHHTGNLQYLFVNRRLLLKTRIHKLLKCIFKSTTFNKQCGSPCVSHVASSTKEHAGELHGVYVININCRYSEYDVCLEPAKTLVEFKDWDSLLYCVEECVRMFLTRKSLLEITTEDTQGLIPPRHCEQVTFSDTGNGSQSICSEFVGGKTLASKPVLRSATVDFTKMSKGSHICNKNTTKDETDTKVEATTGTKLELASETTFFDESPLPVNHLDLEYKQHDLSNSESINCKDSVNDSMINHDLEYKVFNVNFSCNKLTLSHVASPLSKFRRMLEVENQLQECSNHEAICSDTALGINNVALPFVGRVVKPHTDCMSNKRRKMSVANKLSYLKQTKIELCNSTTDNILNVIRNIDTRNMTRLPHSSVENVNGEQVLYNTPLLPSSLNCVEDSPTTSRHDSKMSENSHLSNSLLRPHHIGSFSKKYNCLTAAPPTITVDLTHINTCMPLVNYQNGKFGNYEVIPHPQSACSKRYHTDESQQRNWLVHYDCLAGKKVYINRVTGLSRYEAPSEKETKVSCVSDVANFAIEVITKRGFTSRSHPFQTKVVAPFVFKCRAERVLSTGIDDKVDPETTNALSRLFSAWKNPVFIQPQDVALDVTSGVADHHPVQVHNAMLPYRFTKDMITSMKVIHQVDKKFIACLIDTRNQHLGFNNNPEISEANLLVLVDQHAAHERVRLEGLVAESYEDDPLQQGQKMLCSSVVSPPLEVDIRQEDLRLLRSCQPLLSCLGLDVDFPCSDKACVLLRKVPACFLERESTQSRRGRLSVVKSLVEEYLQEQIKLLHSTRRLQTTLPLTVHNVLASQACHGAIKFNHSLSQEECRSLVRSLAACQLPFQCAHGRPSITPVVDLQQLDSEQDVSKPDLQKLRGMYNAWLFYGKKVQVEKSC